VTQFFDFFLSFHGFDSGMKFFNMHKFFWLMYSGVSGAFPFTVQSHSRIQVLGVSCVEAVSFTQNHVDIVRHLQLGLLEL